MDDLISRQAAIKKFEPWLKVDGYSEGELNMLKAILYELTVMPSAQPRIMTCSKCKHKTKCFSQIAATNKYQTTTIFYDIDFCSRWENEDNE